VSRADLLQQADQIKALIDDADKRIKDTSAMTGEQKAMQEAENAHWRAIRQGLRQQLDDIYRHLSTTSPK